MEKSTTGTKGTTSIIRMASSVFTRGTRGTLDTFDTFSKGFTLPELLIVMTVLAGLAAVMMVSYPASQKRARDTRRISDIKQYQTAIELYANKQGSYQGLTSGVPGNGAQCTLLGQTNCPRDPKAPTQNYSLQINSTAYVLYARLEQQTGTTANYYVVCSDGRSGNCTSAPTGAICGSCP